MSNKIDNILRVIVIVPLLMELIFFVCAATGIYSPENGIIRAQLDESRKYAVETFTVLYALAGFYVALRIMTFRFVRGRIAQNKSRYLKYSIRRIVMLHCIVILSLFTHYVLLCPTTLYFAAIALIGFAFVWPTSLRREQEIMACTPCEEASDSIVK